MQSRRIEQERLSYRKSHRRDENCRVAVSEYSADDGTDSRKHNAESYGFFESVFLKGCHYGYGQDYHSSHKYDGQKADGVFSFLRIRKSVILPRLSGN